MLKKLLCPLAALLLIFCQTSCKKAETQEAAAPEKVKLDSKKANIIPNCCVVSLTVAASGWSLSGFGNTYHSYGFQMVDMSRISLAPSTTVCLIPCRDEPPPPHEELKRSQFEITDIWLEKDKVTPRTCPPMSSQCLWTREQIMYSSGGSLGYYTSAIGYALDELTTINDIVPRIEAEEPIMLMAVLEQLKCRFFRRYSGDAPEIPFTLAEEGNFVIAIYVDGADGTEDEEGNPRYNRSRAAVLQPGWNDREYITWGQAATSVVRPFWGIGDYYATEDFYNGPGVDPSKFFFYVYTPDLCTINGPNCN